MLLKKIYRDSYILCWEKKYKIYYSIERYNIFFILEVKLHIINVLGRHFVSLVGSSAIHILTIYFYANLMKVTKQTMLT